jgi:hypothetical protein
MKEELREQIATYVKAKLPENNHISATFRDGYNQCLSDIQAKYPDGLYYKVEEIENGKM